MSAPDVFKIYDRFGNLFKINFTKGKLYQYENDPKEAIGVGKSIFFQGRFYSFERSQGAVEIQPSLQIMKSMITRQFALKLREQGYQFRKNYRVYKTEKAVRHTPKDIFDVFEGFEFRMVVLDESIMLCLDPHIIFRTNCSIEDLARMGLPLDQLNDFSVGYIGEENKRIDGYLIETLTQTDEKGSRTLVCRVKNYREFTEELVSAEKAFPEAKPELIQDILDKLDIRFDVVSLQRKLSFLDSKTASKDRLLTTMEIVREVKSGIFPLKFGQFKVDIEVEPIIIKL